MLVFEELPLDAGNLKPIQQLHLQVLTFVIFISFGYRETTLKWNQESDLALYFKADVHQLDQQIAILCTAHLCIMQIYLYS